MHPARPAGFPLALIVVLTTALAACQAAEVYVSPEGNDSNPGTGTQPLASFGQAKARVRQLRTANPEEAVTVVFAPGVYRLDQPLEFTPADSGAAADRPVVYQAAGGGEVVIHGGEPVGGWEPAPGDSGLWRARVPDSLAGVGIGQLWVNGRRAVLARTPNAWEYFTLTAAREEDAGNRKKHTFRTNPADLESLAELSGEDLKRVMLVVHHKWDTTHEWLQSVSPSGGMFSTEGGTMKSWNPMARGCLYFFENYRAALDAPGEWFLDADGWLYYMPRPGEDMRTAEVVAPRLERLLTFAGELEEDAAGRVEHIHFDGLAFKYVEYRIPDEGLPPAQAAMNVDNACVLADGASGIVFENCAVEHVGPTAFWFRSACTDCRVQGTLIRDLGITGVRIGETRYPAEPLMTQRITIDNCIIHSGGRILPQAVGVWIGHSPDNDITHCDIGDFFYSGVSAGWHWGYQRSAAKRNRIEYNHIHHLGYGVMSDMGGVYTLGPSEGTSVSHNVIHHVYCTNYGGWGLYPDAGSTGIRYENNVVYDVADGCFHQHYGKENVVQNNIFAFSRKGQIALSRPEPHLSFTCRRNIVYWSDGDALGYNGWKDGKYEIDYNLYWQTGGEPFTLAGFTWEEWQDRGNDEHSIIADPLFVDAENRDFRLREDSPASKIGFEPFDFSKAGLYGDPAWQREAETTQFPEPYTPPEPEPLSFRDDFEQGADSMLLSVAMLNHENRPELIRVTEDTQEPGNHVLRMTDQPDLSRGFNPHFYFDPHYSEGVARLSFRIRADSAARGYCEWRDRHSPYRVGPTLWFGGGEFSSRGERLAAMPENEWVGVEITTPLGNAEATWSLELTFPDGTTERFEDLPCAPDWTEARWIGFSSTATQEAIIEIDDLEVENRSR